MINRKITFVLFLIISAHAQDNFDNDLEFIYKTIVNDHPGLYNPLDPCFSEKLEENYNAAKRELNVVHSEEDRKQALQKFGKSFRDSHLWVKYESGSTTPRRSEDRFFRIEALDQDAYWVYIPSFYPSNESQRRDIQQIIQTLPTLREKSIIFDLRGNRGGSYIWGTELIRALFGDQYTDQHLFQAYRNSYVNWRVSEGNLIYVQESILPILRAHFGEHHPSVLFAENTYQQMEQALLHNAPSYLEKINNKGTFSSDLILNPVKKAIFVIVDRNCYSASLMFIDDLKAMETDVKLIGEVTGADSMYMELRVVPLPSGKGSFGFPINVYKGPIRGHNIPYYPDIQYEENLQNTTELQQFILYRAPLGCVNLDSARQPGPPKMHHLWGGKAKSTAKRPTDEP